MSKYEHGDWFCRPANESEAKEIFERAAASGAVASETLKDCLWDGCGVLGVCQGYTQTQTQTSGFYRDRGFTEYTITELRDLFPLPGEQRTEWNGEGLPPIGVECECSIAGSDYKTCTFVGINSRKSLVIENESGELLEFHDHQIKFRPLRSKRDQWVQYCAQEIIRPFAECTENGVNVTGYFPLAERFYDALRSGQLKAPEVL